MVNIKGELLFSPEHSFEKIGLAISANDKDTLIKAFKDRICGFYLKPAKELSGNACNAFAAGVLCVTAIDCLAFIYENCRSDNTGERFIKWVSENIPEFNKKYANQFYKEFRNGLVHEGRIKNGAQFSYKNNELITNLKGAMVVNPAILLIKISKSFEDYISKVETDNTEYKKLEVYLENFDKELEYANNC